MKIYFEGVQKFIPVYRIYESNNKCAWQSINLKKLIIRKKNLWRDVRRSKNNLAVHDFLVQQYKILSKQCKRLCRNDLKIYEDRILSNCKSNPKLVYKYINDRVKIKESIRAIMNENGELITDPKIITDTFNDWFFTVFKKESCDNMPVCSLPTSFCDNLKFDPIDIAERLSRLDGFKEIGPDQFHPYVFKLCALSLSIPICLLCQKSVDSGVVPELWK